MTLESIVAIMKDNTPEGRMLVQTAIEREFGGEKGELIFSDGVWAYENDDGVYYADAVAVGIGDDGYPTYEVDFLLVDEFHRA